MKKHIKRIYHDLNEVIVKNFRYLPYIQPILLHKIYNSRNEITTLNGTIAEGVDKQQFETFVKYFKKRNVKFINEEDILKGNLIANKQYVYLTFDDGYFNNFNCLPILEKYEVKATFYISTDHVENQKAYWWDSLARELTKRDQYSHIKDLVNEMYQLKLHEQDEYMINNFGPNALKSNNDIDRPMTKKELEVFASNKYVTIGNHTHSHLNLELYSDLEIRNSINSAESFLNQITNQKIKSISYPHGFVNKHISNIAKECGYQIGITTVPKKNRHEDLENPDKRLLLNRIQLSGFFNIETQCRNIHTDSFSILKALKFN